MTVTQAELNPYLLSWENFLRMNSYLTFWNSEPHVRLDRNVWGSIARGRAMFLAQAFLAFIPDAHIQIIVYILY